VLGGDLELAADVMSCQFLEVFRRRSRQVHANSAGDQHLLDSREGPSLTHQFDYGGVVDAEQLTNFGMHARLPATDGFDVRSRATHLIHVGGRATDVADHALEISRLGHGSNFVQDRLLAPRLNDPPLVGGDRAECAAPEAATHDRDRVFDHLECGDRFGVGRMWQPRVGQPVDRVHGRFADRQLGDIADDRLRAMRLHQGAGIERIGFVVNDSRRLGERQFVRHHLLERWQFQPRLANRIRGNLLGP